MSAVAEIARLANMALADIGMAGRVRANPSSDFPLQVAAPYPIADVEVKAVRLARMRICGPDQPTLCDAHRSLSRGGAECAGVPVANALRGVLCLNAGAAS